MADCAKLKFSLSVPRDNVDFQWRGFSDSLVVFVAETMQRIRAISDTDCQEIFSQVKEQLLQEWKNYYLSQVYRLARTELNTSLYADEVDKRTLSRHLEGFDYGTFKSMLGWWLKSGCMIWYVYGNLS